MALLSKPCSGNLCSAFWGTCNDSVSSVIQQQATHHNIKGSSEMLRKRSTPLHQPLLTSECSPKAWGVPAYCWSLPVVSSESGPSLSAASIILQTTWWAWWHCSFGRHSLPSPWEAQACLPQTALRARPEGPLQPWLQWPWNCGVQDP